MLRSLLTAVLMFACCYEASNTSEFSTSKTHAALLNITATLQNITDALKTEVLNQSELEKITLEEKCAELCPSCIGDIFLTVLITILVWSPICYVLSYKWIKFREEIEANAAYEAIRRRTFEMMQQQHGPVQYDSFIGCPVDLYNDRHGPPQIDPSNPPPPTTIAAAIQRKISMMRDRETNRGGGAPI